jgi:hypothetical protein
MKKSRHLSRRQISNKWTVKIKLSELKEMAVKSGNLRKLADSFADANKDEWAKYPHVADIDDMQVTHSANHYVLFKDGAPVAHFQVDVLTKDSAVVDGVWVASEMSGKKVFSRFLWFLKTREHYSVIQFGDVHSQETHQLLAAGGLSRFQKCWKNSSTGEVVQFNAETIDDFYKSSKWKLVLESNDDSFDDFPRFTKGENWIKEAYEWQVE